MRAHPTARIRRCSCMLIGGLARWQSSLGLVLALAIFLALALVLLIFVVCSDRACGILSTLD